jgi:hypothetical protein
VDVWAEEGAQDQHHPAGKSHPGSRCEAETRGQALKTVQKGEKNARKVALAQDLKTISVFEGGSERFNSRRASKAHQTRP